MHKSFASVIAVAALCFMGCESSIESVKNSYLDTEGFNEIGIEVDTDLDKLIRTQKLSILDSVFNNSTLNMYEGDDYRTEWNEYEGVNGETVVTFTTDFPKNWLRGLNYYRHGYEYFDEENMAANGRVAEWVKEGCARVGIEIWEENTFYGIPVLSRECRDYIPQMYLDAEKDNDINKIMFQFSHDGKSTKLKGVTFIESIQQRDDGTEQFFFPKRNDFLIGSVGFGTVILAAVYNRADFQPGGQD